MAVIKNSIGISKIAASLILVVSICPGINHYVTWPVMMVLVALVLIPVVLDGKTNYFFIKAILLAIAFSLFEYWTMHRQVFFLLRMRDNVLAFVPIVTTLFVVYLTDKKFARFYLQLALILILITSITSILGLYIYPDASREQTSYDLKDDAMFYESLNIGGYVYMYSMCVMIPILFWQIPHSKRIFRGINIVTLIMVVWCVYMSAFATALLLVIVAVLLSVVNIKPKLKPLIYVFTIFLVVISGTGLLASFMYDLSQMVQSDYVSDRLLQLSLVFSGTDVANISTETSAERLELFQTAWNSFLSSPIFGHNLVYFDKEALSGHSLVLDTLAGSGLLGIGVLYLIFSNLFKILVRNQGSTTSPYVKLTWFMFFVMSTFNPSGFPLIYMIILTFSAVVQDIYQAEQTNIINE